VSFIAPYEFEMPYRKNDEPETKEPEPSKPNLIEVIAAVFDHNTASDKI
jgi:hypothetical protein